MSHPKALSHTENRPKRPFFLGFVDGARLALTLGVLVCAQAGCLIPQAIDANESVAHAPPHFIVESIPEYLLAPVLTLRRQGTTDAAQTPPCHCALEFNGISVEELDAGVDLDVKWFIDYDATNQASTRPWIAYTIKGDFNDLTKIRRTLEVFRLDADANNIVTSGPHVVEVVVGETAGFDNTSTSQPNRTMQSGYVAAVYKWVVDVHLEQVTGQCAIGGLPAKQVCG